MPLATNKTETDFFYKRKEKLLFNSLKANRNSATSSSDPSQMIKLLAELWNKFPWMFLKSNKKQFSTRMIARQYRVINDKMSLIFFKFALEVILIFNQFDYEFVKKL